MAALTAWRKAVDQPRALYEKDPIMDDVAKYGNYADPYSWKCYEGS